MKARYFQITGMCCIALVMAVAGCQTTSADHEERLPHGYVYYCDGAGGGGVTNWASGLRKGMVDGGYPGAGEIVRWNTGMGVVADQKASVSYKRRKARKMAEDAAEYSKEHPNAPVAFIGLSAGTAIVVFGLEEMPNGARVDDVILCGASISSTYDLTQGLEHVDGKCYVFTSQKDGVLGYLVPMAGTADRARGTVPAAGLRGFQMPTPASPETRKQYAKVVTIPWRPEFAELGYGGGHTDVLNPKFVAAYIAPRITKKVGAVPPGLASTEGEVRNPDYERWAKFGVGSYGITEGHQEYRGVRAPVRVKTTLRSKSADRLEIEREFILTDQDAALPAQLQSVIAEAWIKPKHHPVTDPDAKLADLPAKSFTVKGKTYNCPGQSIDAGGNYPDWGSDLTATVYLHPDIPVGMEVKIQSHFQGEPFKFEGRAVDFKIVP